MKRLGESMLGRETKQKTDYTGFVRHGFENLL